MSERTSGGSSPRAPSTNEVAAGLATIALAAGALVVSAAGARGPASTPFPVNSASVAQQAQELIWKVDLGSPFTAASLKQQRRSLCLLVERPRTGSVSGVVCVDQGRRGPKLVYMQVTRRGRGPAQTISASISRDGATGMTVRFDPTDIGVSYTAIRWQVLSMSKCHTDTEGVKTLFPARPALARLHVPQLVGCVPAGPSTVYGGPTSVHEIALTFDDGPWYDAAVDRLPEPAGARTTLPATFFEIGDQISRVRPDRRGRAADARRRRHDRRPHLDASRRGGAVRSRADQSFELTQPTRSAMRTGFTPVPVAAAVRRHQPALVSLARSLGFMTIMWDIDPRDWSLPGVGEIDGNVARQRPQRRRSSIQHFGGGPRFETLAALPDEITTLRARGYQFVTVAQMLGLRLIYK